MAPEDTLFNVEYSYFINSVVVLHQDLYYHIYYSENTGDSTDYKSYPKYRNGLKYLRDFLISKHIFKGDIEERYKNTVLASIFTVLINSLKKGGLKSFFKDVALVRKDKDIKSVFKLSGGSGYVAKCQSHKQLALFKIIRIIIII